VTKKLVPVAIHFDFPAVQGGRDIGGRKKNSHRVKSEHRHRAKRGLSQEKEKKRAARSGEVFFERKGDVSFSLERLEGLARREKGEKKPLDAWGESVI